MKKYMFTMALGMTLSVGVAHAGLLRNILNPVVDLLDLPALEEVPRAALPTSAITCPAGDGSDGGGVIAGDAGDDTVGGVDLGGDVIATPTPCVPPRVVVSVLDQRLNPYHNFFHNGATSVSNAVLDAFAIDQEHILTLTRTGDAVADRAADRAMWAEVNAGEHYWIAGTNLIVINFAQGARELLARDTKDTSGTSSAASVLAANPDAVVLFVGAGDRSGHDAAEVAGFLHPEVDIVSTGYSASLPLLELGLPSPGFVHSAEAVIQYGKLHFAQTANAPDPTTPLAAGAGPWWSIGIQGVELGTSRGATLLSGLLGDFAADARQILPNCGLCEEGVGSVESTAIATAQAAGVTSRALFELRSHMGQTGGIQLVNGKHYLVHGGDQTINNWQLRRALEVAAAVPKFDDYSLRHGLQEVVGLPPVDVAPWLLIGWGALSPEEDDRVVQKTLAQFEVGTAPHLKSGGFCAFQSINMSVRRIYWNLLSPLLFNTNVIADDPIIRCY